MWLLINSGLWWICAICWMIWWKQVKRSVQTESRGSRLLHLAPTVLSFLLIFSPLSDFNILGERIFDDPNLWGMTGCTLTAVGIGFAIWARHFLGKNWSATVTVKENHQLIRGGPYRITRHPIYTGFVLAILGTVLTQGKISGIAALVLFIATYIRKLRTEEVVAAGVRRAIHSISSGSPRLDSLYLLIYSVGVCDCPGETLADKIEE